MRSLARMRTIRLALLIRGSIRGLTPGFTLGLVLGMGICAAAQTASQSQPEATPTPAPAFGQNAPILNPENPPVTGLDEPRLELPTASRSFVSPALQVSESVDTNGSNQLGSTRAESVTRVLGALDLQQFWPRSDVFLEYLGGGAFFSRPYEAKQLQAVGFEGITRWRTGQATLRDSFNYLPDGSFAIGTFGGVPGLGLATGGGTSVGGGLPGMHLNGQFGSVGNIPRLDNTAILDVVQTLSPRSAITVAGGFSNAHFYDPANNLINSDQITAQGGYSHLLSRHDQIGVLYGFQLFQFPQNTGGQIYNHIVNIRWSHTISERLSFIAGAGPQYTELQQGGDVKRWSVSARVQFRYKFAHSSVFATYEKFTSDGSGFFAGAETQAARLGYKRSLARTVDFYGDLGYSHNKKLQDFGFFGASANTYDEGYVSLIFRKHFGRDYDLFGAYRFSEVGFDVPVTDCLNGFGCGRLSQRHVGTIGVEWHPRPTRID
jgi:hypothetical protein